MTTPNTPIVNAGELYVSGFSITVSGTNSLGISPGMARDSTNTNDLSVSGNGETNLLMSRVGLNGLDTGVLVASKFYAVFVIGDSTKYLPTGYLISLSVNSPVLPKGYDMFRRIGWARTDSSAINTRLYQYGGGLYRKYYYEVPLTILTGGTAGTFSAGTVDLSTSSFVPPLYLENPAPTKELEALIGIVYTAALAGNTAEFALANAASIPMLRFGTGVAGVQIDTLQVPTVSFPGGMNFRYRVAASDSLTLTICGFTDVL